MALARKTSAKGYALVHLPGHVRADVRGYVYEHVVIAEAALGKPLPARAQVHHANEDKADSSRGNLVVCQDQAYHMLLHRRAAIARAGGDPNSDSICMICKEVKPRSAFNRDRTRRDGHRYECRDCSALVDPRRSTYRPKGNRGCS